MKFHLNSFNGCQLTEWTRNSIANDQREITKKNIQSTVMALVQDTLSHCAYKCTKFQPNIFNNTERTRNCIYLCYKGDNL